MKSSISFPDVHPEFGINCSSNPMEGIRVAIGPLNGFRVGDVLNLSWEGFSDPELTKPVPETLTSLNHFVVQDDIDNGLIKTIGEYYQHIKPIRIGWGKASYAINGNQPTQASVRVHLLNGVGQTCDEIK
jgi:hypothetical protein